MSGYIKILRMEEKTCHLKLKMKKCILNTIKYEIKVRSC